jgi:hypothetical protein
MAEVAETLVLVAREPGKERIAGFEPRISDGKDELARAKLGGAQIWGRGQRLTKKRSSSFALQTGDAKLALWQSNVA